MRSFATDWSKSWSFTIAFLLPCNLHIGIIPESILEPLLEAERAPGTGCALDLHDVAAGTESLRQPLAGHATFGDAVRSNQRRVERTVRHIHPAVHENG